MCRQALLCCRIIGSRLLLNTIHNIHVYASCRIYGQFNFHVVHSSRLAVILDGLTLPDILNSIAKAIDKNEMNGIQGGLESLWENVVSWWWYVTQNMTGTMFCSTVICDCIFLSPLYCSFLFYLLWVNIIKISSVG